VVGRLTTIVVLVLAATAVYKVSVLRRDSVSAQFALAGIFVFLTLGVAPFTSVFRLVVDGQTSQGWREIGARIFVVLAAAMAQAYVLLLARPLSEVRSDVSRRVVVGIVISVILVALGLVTNPLTFATADLEVWSEAAVHLVFQTYLATTLADVTIAAVRWARSCADVVRVGLRLVAAGAGLGMTYAVGKVVATIVELTVGRSDEVVAFFQVVALAGLVLVAAGSALPAIARSWRSGRRALLMHRKLDRLYPLWSDLVTLVPGIALERVEPRWRDRLHVRDLDMRLYRRIIEIRDGQLALARADVGTLAVLSAIGAHPVPQSSSPATSQPPATVDDEVAWWLDVASSYAGLRRVDARATAP
jgi:hypothetical protein